MKAKNGRILANGPLLACAYSFMVNLLITKGWWLIHNDRNRRPGWCAKARTFHAGLAVRLCPPDYFDVIIPSRVKRYFSLGLGLRTTRC